ncbi:MAG: terminase family protein [Archaeoglobaceae archaeon]
MFSLTNSKSRLQSLRELSKRVERIKSNVEKKTKIRVPDDLIEFATMLGYPPTEYQKKFIENFLAHRWIALCWSRQSGKTQIVSIALLWYAIKHNEVHIAIIGPSWRQTKRIIQVINNLLRRLGYRNVQKTKVVLPNGSVIEAFPNNPDTIRGYAFHIVYFDEMNFVRNDEEMYDAIIFTLNTTNGKFIASSTPGRKDSVFYRIFNDKAFEKFVRHRVTWHDALEPKGPLKIETVEDIKNQYAGDIWRWQREMEAVWVEDADSYFPMSLITKCIDSELDYADFDMWLQGEFYIGCDLGKKLDYSVVAVVERACDKDGKERLKLIHMHRFPLETPYASVIGYIKTLTDRYKTVHKILIDQTGVGEYVVEDMKNAGIPNTEGIILTMQRKQEILGHMRQQMQNDVLRIPYDADLIAEINIEKFELTKEGQIKFSHPEGTHDDRLWALALAVYAASQSPGKIKAVSGKVW